MSLLSRREQTNQQKEIGLHDETIWTRSEGNTVHMCGDSRMADTWINGCFLMANKYRGTIGRIPAYPVQSAETAKHIYREHNQEADHMAHREVEGVSKVKVQTAKTYTDADKQYDDFWTEAGENMEAVYPAS